MVAQRFVVRSLVAASLLGFLHVSFVGCGSSDDTKTSQETDGGEAGQVSSAGGSANEPNPTGGGAGATSQAGGVSSDGGVGGPDERAGAGGEGTPGPGEAGAASSGATNQGGEMSGAGGSAGGAAGAEAGGAASSGAAGAGGELCLSEGSRISLTFDASNAERVTSLTWVDSDGATTANLAVSGGSSTCGDPSEFFGSSYGAPEGTTPLVIYAGTRATAVTCGLDVRISSQPTNCNAAAQIPASTDYHFYGGLKASQVRVTRRVTFDATSPSVTATALRTWQPRVSRATFPDTIYPSSDGSSVTKVTVGASCGGDCLLAANADWNKQWFAMVGPSGLAVVVRRDPSLTTPIGLTMNWDSFSFSNLSSFVWPKPAEGFVAPLEEIEYLCLADLKSWPQTERDAAQLPAFCGP
jgi:hypothetical protein